MPLMDERGPGSQIPEAIRTLLTELGEDPDRAGLAGTPDRVRRMYAELTDGYAADPEALLNRAAFEVDYDEMVVVRDIEFYSLCEHHLLPFFGRAHIAYVPRGKVVGLSKLPRIVDAFAHRLQLQERMTRQIAEALNDVLDPSGVAVVIEARHLCMEMRGVEKQDSETITSTTAI